MLGITETPSDGKQRYRYGSQLRVGLRFSGCASPNIGSHGYAEPKYKGRSPSDPPRPLPPCSRRGRHLRCWVRALPHGSGPGGAGPAPCWRGPSRARGIQRGLKIEKAIFKKSVIFTAFDTFSRIMCDLSVYRYGPAIDDRKMSQVHTSTIQSTCIVLSIVVRSRGRVSFTTTLVFKLLFRM